MSLDFHDFYGYLEQVLRESKDFEHGMSSICDRLEAGIPHPDWQNIKSRDLKDDIAHAREWMNRLAKASTCSFNPKGIFVGIAECYDPDYEDDYGNFGPEFADLYLVLYADGDSGRLEFIFDSERHDFDDDAKANLKQLKEIGMLCNTSDDGIGSEGYIAYSVAYVLLMLREILDGKIFEALHGEQKICVVSGFGSGDLFCIGDLTGNGLCLNTKSLVMQ